MRNRNVEVYRFLIPREKFDRIPDSEKIFLIFGGHLLNELALLNRLLVFAQNTPAKTIIEREARSTQLLILVRLTIGKLYESSECLRKTYFTTVLPRVYEKQLSIEASESLTRIKKYFGKKNPLESIRNNYAFHYSRDEVSEWLRRMPKRLRLSANMAITTGNSLFSFSEDVIMNSAMNMHGAERSPARSFERIFRESIAINTDFQSFVSSMMSILIEKYVGRGTKQLRARRFQVKSRSADRTELPCFLRRREK